MGNKVVLVNIRTLYRVETNGSRLKKGGDMQEVHPLHDAFVSAIDGKISEVGEMKDLKPDSFTDYQKVDCSGKLVFPGFVDSHTHLVFSHTREAEFVMRIKGMTYEEIATNGGGILNSAKRLRETSEEELLRSALQRAKSVMSMGTTTLEVKSGYGLTYKDELKMLRVANSLKSHIPAHIKTTFLGAHAIPAEFKTRRGEYIDLICNEMIPAVAEEKLANFIDVFCDKGFFTPEETERILTKGADYGLPGKIHANELDISGGVQVGDKCKALSVDHLECIGDEEIKVLQKSSTIPTLLPGTAFFLGIPYPPARKLIDAGIGCALASDYNPGSCPSGNMSFIMALAATRLKMLPSEALSACTLNAAATLGMAHEVGSIEVGKSADFVITKPIDNLNIIPYSFGENLVDTVMIKGVMLDN